MVGRGRALPPQAWLVLVGKQPRYALPDIKPCRASGDPAFRRALEQTHRYWKAHFRFLDDGTRDTWEPWRTRTGALSGRKIAEGDCEDWALGIRDAFIQQRCPIGALRLVTCQLASGRGHAVLAVETEACTLISDVLQAHLLPWTVAVFRPYTWLAWQVPGQWWWESLRSPTTLGKLLKGLMP